MKRILFIGLAVIGLILAAAVIVPFLVPNEVYRAQIEAQAEKALGRDVTLDGKVEISVFPQISAKVNTVSVANPDGFSRPHMITAGALKASVRWMPLLSKRVEIAELAFIDADVALEVNESGETNWAFGTGEPTPAPEGSTSSGGGFDAGVDRARLANSSLSYTDARSGAAYALTELDLEASLKALNRPLAIDGKGKFQGEAFDVDALLTTPQAAIDGAPIVADFRLRSDMANVSYDGSLSLAGDMSMDGAFEASSNDLGKAMQFAGVDLGMDLSRLGALDAKGTVSGPVATPKLTISSFDQSSDLMKATYQGVIDLGSDRPLDGAFTASVPNLTALTSFAGMGDMPMNLAPLGGVTARGQVSGALASPKLVFDALQQSSGLMNATYTGSIDLSSGLVFGGKLDAKLSDAGRLLTQLGFDMPTLGALEAMDINADLSGPLEALNLANLSVDHTSDLLKATYKGAMQLGANGTINGNLDASSMQLRALLQAAAIEIAPGETLQSFSVKGALSGTPSNLTVGNMALDLDDLSGTGNAGLDLRGAKPKLSAALAMDTLNLSPFLGEGQSAPNASAPTPSGWSKEPLALDSLKALDADIALTTKSITVGKITLTNADIATDLSNGALSADIAGFNAFGGDWTGKIGLDVSTGTPALSVDMTGSSIAIESMLSTFANIESLSGLGEIKISATSRGTSIDALMNGLNGSLGANLADGALKGFNIAQIVRSANDIPAALSSGSLNFGLSPEAETDFTDFDTLLTVRNGVANIDLLKLINPAAVLDGAGEIRIGAQSLDISITPKVDTRGGGNVDQLKLNGKPFAIPFRLSGTWTSPKVGIDSRAIQQQLQSTLAGEVKDRLADELGGDLGDTLNDALGDGLGDAAGGLLSDALGIETKSDPAPTPAPETATGETETTPPEEAEEPKSAEDQIEDALEDAASDALNDLFGRKKKD